MKEIIKAFLGLVFWSTLLGIVILLFCALGPARGATREIPREVLCVRDGFVVYNGVASGLHKVGPSRFTFLEVMNGQAKPRSILGACYAYVEGTWEKPDRMKK